ncbi:hypothetical protein GYH30_006697 [Glycine max]|uniref:ATP-dependent DNA helicase n=1 Tax=Glycine max TaxID=3847 RepID=A0A0R0KGL1_SOYBN|nr:hypothetical protein GYH30_006697 [Glycine max]
MSVENFHHIGSLLPNPECTPKFSQLYIYDTNNEIRNNMFVVRVIRLLQCIMPKPTMKLRILGKRDHDYRRYNLLVALEVASLIPGDFDFADAKKILDTYSTIESLILKWFKTHQNEKTEIYKGVLEAILRGETDPLTLGRRIVLSSSFVGGARYMHKNYQYHYLDHDVYHVSKRRDIGLEIKKGEYFLDNRFVVSYNKQLLLLFNAHINVEWYNQSRSIKIFSFDINHSEPSIEGLPFHFPDEQVVGYRDDDPIQEVNQKYLEAINLTYSYFPREIFYMRTLLNYVKRPHSYSQTRTTNNIDYPKFKEACYAMGLLNDDKVYIDANHAIVESTIIEACQMSNWPTMPQPNLSNVAEIGNRLIYDELNYDTNLLAEQHSQLMTTMIKEQRTIYDIIMDRVANDKPSLFFVFGYRSIRKTFIWRSLFAIPLNVDENSTCDIKQGSQLATLLSRTNIIIWDEAPMTHKHCFEVVDRTFRDIGKLWCWGDSRQILLIPKGTRQKIVNATINSSYLWHFCEVVTLNTNMRLQTGSSTANVNEKKKVFFDWVLGVADNSIGECNDVNIDFPIPHALIEKGNFELLKVIVNSTYPTFLDNLNDKSYFQERDVLAPKNDIVNIVNDYIDVHNLEFLNKISTFGLPNHMLSLKIGVPIVLLRNIDQASGLCNGTHLIITKMRKYILEGDIIS